MATEEILDVGCAERVTPGGRKKREAAATESILSGAPELQKGHRVWPFYFAHLGSQKRSAVVTNRARSVTRATIACAVLARAK